MYMSDTKVDHTVKLEGTNYDHRRRLTLEDVSAINTEYFHGASISSLANKYNVSYITIQYHVDPQLKKEHNKKRNMYRPSIQDSVAQRVSRIARKRAILEGRV